MIIITKEIFFAKNKREYIEKIAEELFPLFIKSLIDNKILELLNSDMPDYKKQKIYCELTNICNDLMFDYKNIHYKSMLSGVNKVINFNKNIFQLLK